MQDVELTQRSPEGALIRQHRIRADLTQQWLADRTSYQGGVIGMVESGRWRPNDRFIREVSAALKLSLAEEQALLAARAQPWTRPGKFKTKINVTFSNPDSGEVA